MNFSDAQAQRLTQLYSDGEREILNELGKALVKGNSTTHLKLVLNNVQAIREDLLAGARTWMEQALPEAYLEGMKEAGVGAVTSFSGIHQQAMQVLAENTYQRMVYVDQVIGRRTDDIYRNLALENIRGTVAGYQTWKQVAKNYRERLAEKGITGFTDSAGRQWNMKTYSEVVARTSTRQTMVEGTKNRLLEHDIDLVEITGGVSDVTCEECAAMVGEVFSLTGKTPGYPVLDLAPPIHPNCTHGITAYFEEEETREGEDGEE
jgi:hypothetical protein